MMALSVVRFWANGWIEKLYLEPTYFFSYRYFEWVKPLGPWTYGLFALLFVSALAVMVGWRYRPAIGVFFLAFTYVELMDKTTYLNHYYFVSLLSFALFWLPAADYFAVDATGKKTVPRWTIDCLKVFVGVVYFYAGLAKLNSDWLLAAQPLAIWLPSKYSLPLLGDLLQQRWVHYAFSWAGAAYDLLIPFLLLWRPTRVLAFAGVVVFHVLTRVLFPIGMFPYIMIVSALIFFDGSVHERILSVLRRLFRARPQDARKVGKEQSDSSRNTIHPTSPTPPTPPTSPLSPGEGPGERVTPTPTQRGSQIKNQKSSARSTAKQIKNQEFSHPKETTPTANLPTKSWSLPKLATLTLLSLHLLLPWRHLAYPGELFWTESGYRFSWRVMLMEKAGYLNYTLVDPASGKRRQINPGDYLTSFQLKQLSTQPDFILEFAHHLASLHQKESGPLPAVYAESYVALNGRGSQVYVRPDVDLTTVDYATPRTEWLAPFGDTIYGL